MSLWSYIVQSCCEAFFLSNPITPISNLFTSHFKCTLSSISRPLTLYPGSFLYLIFLDESNWPSLYQIVVIKKWFRKSFFQEAFPIWGFWPWSTSFRNQHWTYMLIFMTLNSHDIGTKNRFVGFDSEWIIMCWSWSPLSVARNSLNDCSNEAHVRWCYSK